MKCVYQSTKTLYMYYREETSYYCYTNSIWWHDADKLSWEPPAYREYPATALVMLLLSLKIPLQ